MFVIVKQFEVLFSVVILRFGYSSMLGLVHFHWFTLIFLYLVHSSSGVIWVALYLWFYGDSDVTKYFLGGFMFVTLLCE